MENNSILITGASSGIGEALALEYADFGTHLVLCGRNLARLTHIANSCRKKGATVHDHIADVTDKEAMNNLIHAEGPFNIVFANAGISGERGAGFSKTTRKIFSVNVAGITNTVIPSVETMLKNGGGQIGIVSSIAGFRGLASAPAYSASKAFVKIWGEALRSRFASSGIRVCVICPGFVESRITANNDFYMPFLMTASRAAHLIRQGMQRNKRLIIFPWQMYLAIKLLMLLPNIFFDYLTNKFPNKE
ncbi:MAG: short-chain dehydrogenase [Rhodospirillaceae bacterium]|nr:short-chain dehydrogenase [Rhodospirillaceae bacterium]